MKNLYIVLLLTIGLGQDYSLDFSSGNYGRIPMSESLSNFNEFTMEFWYHETGGHGSDEMIVGTEYFSGNKYGVYSFIDGFWPYVSTEHTTLGIVYNGSNGDDGISYSSNNWYHLALSYDENIFRFFLDGIIVYEEEGQIGLFGPEDEDLVINRHTWANGSSSSSRLTGQIDELRISNKARYTQNFSPPNYEFISDDNTMGLWHFNNDFNDYSGNDNHGIHNGTGYSNNTPNFINVVYGCTDPAAGNYDETANVDDGTCTDYPDNGDYSLSFDGNSYVSIPDNPILNWGYANYTVAVWIRKSNSSPWLQTIVSKEETTSGNYYGWKLGLIYNNLKFRPGGGNNGTWINNGTIESDYLINDGQWYSVVGVFDGINGNTMLYVNGQLYATTPANLNVNPNNSQDLKIGAHMPSGAPSGPEYFFGEIDNVQIWNSALSEEEIQFAMSIQVTGEEDGLIGYWKFNAGDGTTLYDHSGNGNHGTIYGATWSTNVPFSGTTTSDLSWSVKVKASIGSYNDNDNYLGVASDATNNFDAAYDEVEPPASPGSSISLYFPHPEWNSILGDNFSTDARPEIALTDTMQAWDFEVQSTDAGDATLTFIYSSVPTVPVILENTATGERKNLSNNETYTFTAVADSSHPFRISIGDTTAPALTLGESCTGPAVLISGSTHSLGWTSTDGYEIDSMMVSFSSDSGTTYALQASLGAAGGYEWTVPDATVMTAGKFKVKSQDYAGNSTEKISDYVFAIAGDSLSSSVLAGWTLWGAPINPANDTMQVNLDDDFSNYWVTYDYMDNGYTYDGILKESEGYWLGAIQDASIDVKGTPVDSNFTLSLSQGWELISNPLVLDVSVDSLTFTKDAATKTHAEAVTAGWINSIYGYDGSGYVSPEAFTPWSGYWMAVLETDVDMTFPIHRHDSGGSARILENGWMITFDAQVESANDGTTMIGYAETATDGFDAQHDAVKPPNPPGPEYISLYIPHPEWNYLLGDRFSKDIRSSLTESTFHEWKLSMESSKSDVQLGWTLTDIPEDYEVGYSIDGGIHFDDMRVVNLIDITADTEIIVRVGTQSVAIDEALIPSSYSLNNAYPNPFNPITNIQYELPEIASVTITVYDMAGRETATLYNGKQTPGYHTISWDASYHSSGIYFVTMVAGEYVNTQKLMLIK